jgi:hypothetical protein
VDFKAGRILEYRYRYSVDLRQFLKHHDDKERREYWEKSIAATLPGVTLDDCQFIQPTALDKPIEFHYKITARLYSHQAGPLLLVRPHVVGSYVLFFDDKPRIYPIDLDFASYHSSVSAKGSLLHYEREYVVCQVEISPAKAADFRRLESAILADERDSVVLKIQ